MWMSLLKVWNVYTSGVFEEKLVKIPCDRKFIFPSYIAIQYSFPSEVFLHWVFFKTNKTLSLFSVWSSFSD